MPVENGMPQMPQVNVLPVLFHTAKSTAQEILLWSAESSSGHLEQLVQHRLRWLGIIAVNQTLQIAVIFYSSSLNSYHFIFILWQVSGPFPHLAQAVKQKMKSLTVCFIQEENFMRTPDNL